MLRRQAPQSTPLPRAEYAEFVGTAVAKTLATLADRYRLSAPLQELLDEHERELLAWYRSPALMPGAAALVEAAQAAGLQLAIASSAPEVFVGAAAEGMPFGRHFAAVVSADHPRVGAPKPAPDIYAVACELLGVEPSEATAIEDSPTGVRAALAAGLPAVAVPNEWTHEHPFPDGAVLVASLTEVSARLWGQSRPRRSRSA